MLNDGSKVWNTRAARLALLISVPLAVLGGVHAVTWAAATLKTWNTGDTLTAADLNANFAALAAQQTPANVLAGVNAATMAGGALTVGAVTAAAPKYDLRWLMQHAAASAACAALSPTNDSGSGHVVLPRSAGVACSASCAANSGGFTSCRAMVAIGQILPTQAAAYSDIISTNYNYSCADTQNGFDEVKGQGVDGSSSFYTGYCCCYK
jgi:hypothetical protein